MESREYPALVRTLTRVGLVLSGLLAGVLIMQIQDRARPEFPASVRTVEFHKNVSPPGEQDLSLEGVYQLNEQFKRVADHVKRAVVSIHAASSWYNLPCAILRRKTQEYRDRESLGSGVLISPQGYIVTNYHLVEDACALRVTFVNKKEYDAEVVGIDRSTDLAVIRIVLEPGQEVVPIKLGSSDEVHTGEWVLAVGNPLALTSTVTAGIVSAKGRYVDVIKDEFNVESFIQTDAAINPGNSGGALVNLRGELIGINTAIATQTGYNEGYGFAIPVNLVDRIMRDLIAYGEVKRGYMGVRLAPIDASFARDLGMEWVHGVYLDDVRRRSAAYTAGLREGDVVTEFEGQVVNETNELQSFIAQRRPGDQITLKIWRQGEVRYHVVTLAGEEDPGVAAWISSLHRQSTDDALYGGELYRLDRWGITIRSLRSEDRSLFGVSRGIYLLGVWKESVAGEAGVPDHVVLKEINGEPVSSLTDARQALENADEVDLALLYEDGRSEAFHLSAK